MKDRDNIIDKVISTPRSRELVRQVIPILIRWAKAGKTNGTYGDIIHEIGMKSFNGIGRVLENIQIVIETLKRTSEVQIPTLNSLVKNKLTMLPSDGFDYVCKDYSRLDIEGKRVFVEGLDNKAFKYKQWDWVLANLGLESDIIITEEELQEKTNAISNDGGEGNLHKELKEYIYEHPKSIGLKDVVFKSKEYTLPSGDRIDVYFVKANGDRVAVEVKPFLSLDEDIMRGIFQCVKYKAVLEAVRIVESESFNVTSILVVGGLLSDQNRKIANDLDMVFYEKFRIK